MKRFIAALLTMTALALAVVTAASADAVGDSSKACADITFGTAGYTGYAPDNGDPANVVIATVNYAAPTCAGVKYALLVFDKSGTNLLGVQILRGNGSSSLDFQLNNIVGTDNGDGTQSVCVASLSFQGSKIYDSGPDSGCGIVTSGGSGGGAVPPI